MTEWSDGLAWAWGTPGPARLEHHLVNVQEWQHKRGEGRYVAQRFWRAGDAGVRYLLDKATLGPQQPEQLSRADTAIKKSSNPIQSLK